MHYDVITAQECRYYLYNRRDRADYMSMLPVLETLMNLREQEETDEAPFIQLVLDECQRKNITADWQTITERVIWWKTKNKWKRAITADDTKALRMIVRALQGKDETDD